MLLKQRALEHRTRRWVAGCAFVLATACWPVQAQMGDSTITEAREALRKKDQHRLAARARRLPPTATRWRCGSTTGSSATALADAAGRARRVLRALDAAPTSKTGCATTGCSSSASAATGATSRIDFPRFRMNDDREVSCYALLTEHLDGKDVRDAGARGLARAARRRRRLLRCWLRTVRGRATRAQADVWRKARLAIEADRQRAARQAVDAGRPRRCGQAAGDLLDSPARYLTRRSATARARNARRAGRRWR